MSKSGQSVLRRVLSGGSGRFGQDGLSQTLRNRLAVPGLHEQKISQDLGQAALHFTGNEPIYARPLVLLAFTNRSGSSLLAEYMRQSGVIQGMGEFANHDFVHKQMRERELERFPDLIRSLADRVPARQLFGLKASWDQIMMLARWNIPAMFTGLKIVHITRRDPLDQAISYSIADQTRQWSSEQKASKTKPVFDAGALDRIMQEQQSQNTLIQLVGNLLDVTPYGIVYEGLCANPTGHMRAILAYCGIPRPLWEPEPPRLKKQAGPVNQAFRDQWLEAVRSNVFGTEARMEKKPGKSSC